jgi:nickel-dependent lactate racemase
MGSSLQRIAASPGQGQDRGVDNAPDLSISALDQPLATEAVRDFISRHLQARDFAGRDVVVIIPDSTRSCPLQLLIDTVYAELAPQVSRLRVLIALGTHPEMSTEQIEAMFEVGPGELTTRYPKAEIINHEWWRPSELTSIGTIEASRVAELSEGRLSLDVDVTINKAVTEADDVLIVGPVFPHEVVGFSGGTKYLFPGVSGQQMIDVSHWLGALITSSSIIGTTGITPVRAMINEAASKIDTNLLACCVVVQSGTHDLHGVAFGEVQDAWRAASMLSANTHIRYRDEPVRRVISIIPRRYDEIWTAAKGMYKVEPIVADGGEVIIYAPHISVVSHTHGADIAKIGYHCRDYFAKRWDEFKDHPWGVLAHSTHVRGAGSWTPEDGEQDRITVTLATSISEEETAALALNYRDPAELDLDAARNDPDTLVVDNAGEILFRLGEAPTID